MLDRNASPVTFPEQTYSHTQWAKLVKTRDGWECVNARTQPEKDHTLFQLNAHHIVPKKVGGTNLQENGITYCRACHAAEHPEFQQKFSNVLKMQMVSIKDFVFGLIGVAPDMKYYQLLYFLTGKTSFRPLQKTILKTIVEKNKHVFVVMPTGFGKSLLYQIPAVLNADKPSLILSPLKALQMDQVSESLKKWIPSTFINSSLSADEINSRIENIQNGDIALVYVHPKQLLHFDEQSQSIHTKHNKPLTKEKFKYLVLDEVHVVESQGLSFVKEYYYIEHIYNLYDKPQLILLTATASKKTREFIISKLGVDSEEIVEFVGDFRRPEISLEVFTISKLGEKNLNKNITLLTLLANKPSGKTIIFATTIKQVDSIYEFLQRQDVAVCRYHGSLPELEKEEQSRRFKSQNEQDKVDVMVATSAYGMGINIPNIHQVIHYSLPFSLTDYYQQIGRAGRDRKSSVAQLLYDPLEKTNLTDFITKKIIEKEKNTVVKNQILQSYLAERAALLEYVESNDKWEYIQNYFGSPSADGAGYWLYTTINRMHWLYKVLLFLLVVWLAALIF